MLRTNYIFVDYENTQELDLDLIEGKPVQVFLILGGKQERLSVPLVKSLLKYSAQVRVIETEQSGNHALDFVLACQIGAQSVADPAGFFHILSRDKGFDAVIRHLKERKIFGARHEEFAKIPVLAKQMVELKPIMEAKPVVSAVALPLSEVKVLTIAERVEELKSRFANPKTTRPAKLKTLRSAINSWFHKQLSEAQTQAIVAGLVAAKVLSVSADGKVKYLA